ncbi:MAG: tRNA (adenosine(37)-N6)-threonylcarbamoyltransferase complex ATPase subunit type 1 TsaE [Eubacteriales bacterium]|jgi:tRNA threonylcarbamoyladenosine biosynthesis protein TsaE
MEYITHSEEETQEVGRQLGQRLQPNDVIAYFGDLGAGKTAFTKGVAQGLDIQEYVTSPTFSIVSEYEGRLPLYHFDVYRIQDGDALYDIGYYDYLENGGVCAIEWSENIEAYLPPRYYRVSIARGTEESDRVITIEKMGE